MKVTLRLNPLLGASLERIVPKDEAILSGVAVPEGTVVGCVGRTIHLDQEYYGEDSDTFRPERWLENPKLTVLMDRTYMLFGSGNQICLGRYIAEHEIKRVIPALLLNFKVGFLDLTACVGRSANMDEI
jgi:cytochrome P450